MCYLQKCSKNNSFSTKNYTLQMKFYLFLILSYSHSMKYIPPFYFKLFISYLLFKQYNNYYIYHLISYIVFKQNYNMKEKKMKYLKN